jgi:hypothetical protein
MTQMLPGFYVESQPQEPEEITYSMQELAAANLMLAKREAEQKYGFDEAAMVAAQQAGQRSVLGELRTLLDPKLEQDVSTTNTALLAAQGEAEQQRVAIQRHEGSRPGLGATPSDIRAWSGERALLVDMLETYARNETAAASAHQAARERLQAAMRHVYGQRRAQLQRDMEAVGRSNQVKVDAARAELDRVIAECNGAYNTLAQELNRLDRYWPGQ